MKSIEHAEQVLLMQWWALSHQRFGIPEQLLFAIPNGGLRNIVTAARMKKEGVRAGIPDLMLAYPTTNYPALFIEMKRTDGGRLSDSQKTMIKILEYYHYKCVVCHGWEQARAEIESYIKENRQPE